MAQKIISIISTILSAFIMFVVLRAFGLPVLAIIIAGGILIHVIYRIKTGRWIV